MRIYTFFYIFLIFNSDVFAGHIGCVTFYDKALCETEQSFQYKSEALVWELTKDQFKQKIKAYLDHKVPGHTVRMATVFLWVNDFNSQSSLRIQTWEADRSFILDVPADIRNVDLDIDLSVRGAGNLPYPIDFGYTLGELVIVCKTDCTKENRDWLASAGYTDVQVMLAKMLLVQVNAFGETKAIDDIRAKDGFNSLFKSIERAPVFEGTGFRELAFTIYELAP